jgi:hypothetical protein
MFDQLTDTENTVLWTKLRSATSKYHAAAGADLMLPEWSAMLGAELETIELREDLTGAYGKAPADA